MNAQIPAINQTIAVEYLKFFFPTIRQEIAQLKHNFAATIQATVNYVKNLVREAKINIIKHHIKLIDWLYRNGNVEVRIMIENLFIRSFESFRKLSKTSHWKQIYEYMPIEFQQIYMNHIKLDEIMFKKK
ncbi:DUF7674 family protein [Chryseobacterium camelliae]|uniref:DUF7674 family protein n=1 Tax=Chryseobacterium camelliae TaxID=1265445 RepID=UPI000C1C8A36|nr:hypothetical protein [Chryseobacterium camelliae]MDR6514397.1 hypothetical protein [Chryseobacterium camelliae]